MITSAPLWSVLVIPLILAAFAAVAVLADAVLAARMAGRPARLAAAVPVAGVARRLVGGYRFVAQGLAYELPLMFALISAATGAQSLDVADIVAAQAHLWFAVW